MNGDGELLDLVLAVNLGLGLSVCDELLLLLFVDILACNMVKIACLPEGLGSLCPQDLVVDFHLLVVMLQVTVRHDVVVSLGCVLNSFASDSLL